MRCIKRQCRFPRLPPTLVRDLMFTQCPIETPEMQVFLTKAWRPVDMELHSFPAQASSWAAGAGGSLLNALMTPRAPGSTEIPPLFQRELESSAHIDPHRYTCIFWAGCPEREAGRGRSITSVADLEPRTARGTSEEPPH